MKGECEVNKKGFSFWVFQVIWLAALLGATLGIWDLLIRALKGDHNSMVLLGVIFVTTVVIILLVASARSGNLPNWLKPKPKKQ
jgi:hypothetical protein